MTISKYSSLKRNITNMKKTLTVLLATMITFVSLGQSELTKQERKALVAQAKSFKKNPALLNQLLLDKATADEKVNVSEKQLNVIKEQMAELRAEIEVTELKNEMLENQIALANQKPTKVIKPASQEVQKGVVFRVQIGGFKRRNLLEYNEDENLIRVETNPEGVQEISLGVFRNYKKADVFKKHLREMGLKDAWIVPYKDGKRVPLKEVYNEALLSSKDK